MKSIYENSLQIFLNFTPLTWPICKTMQSRIVLQKILRKRYFNRTLLFSTYIDDIKEWIRFLSAGVRFDENE